MDKYADTILLVVDVESNGPSVRQNSAFALGGVAIRVSDKRVLGGFAYNFPERAGSAPYGPTLDGFWLAKERAMYDYLHAAQVPLADAMRGIAQFVAALKAAHPAAVVTFTSDCAVYDWKWVDTELSDVVPHYTLGYSAFDIPSYAAGALKVPRHKAWDALFASGAVCLPADGVKHDHDPYNDAMYEAVLAVDTMRLAEGVPWTPLLLAAAHSARPVNTSWLLA